MKTKFAFPSMEKLRAFFRQYKLIVVLLAVGGILLLLPQNKGDVVVSGPEIMTAKEEDFSVEHLEHKLSEILSRIEGAGRVSVMLTVKSGAERIYASDREMSEQNEQRELQEEMVLISIGDGESAVLIGQNYPVFQGALLVCEGGDDPLVRLRLTEALTALTGLSSNRVTVCKGS